MDEKEFEARLNRMTPEELQDFRKKTGAVGAGAGGDKAWEIQRWVDEFISDAARERKYCRYFGRPTESERIAKRTLLAAWLACLISVASIIIPIGISLISANSGARESPRPNAPRIDNTRVNYPPPAPSSH
jgi:hypothetical protein